MSMRDYAVDDYGMLLKEDDLEFMYNSSYNSEIPSDFSYEDIAYSLDTDVEEIGAFTGEVFTIDEEGHDDYYSGIYYSDETVYYVPFKNTRSLFSTAYSNIDEIINEMKEKTGNYLPDNFDYRGRICHILGTYYG